MRLFFALFGYAKIPVQAVMLNVQQEHFLEEMLKISGDECEMKEIARHLDGQRSLTKLLRSCRLI
jgi:hypothetical protein